MPVFSLVEQVTVLQSVLRKSVTRSFAGRRERERKTWEGSSVESKGDK